MSPVDQVDTSRCVSTLSLNPAVLTQARLAVISLSSLDTKNAGSRCRRLQRIGNNCMCHTEAGKDCGCSRLCQEVGINAVCTSVAAISSFSSIGVDRTVTRDGRIAAGAFGIRHSLLVRIVESMIRFRFHLMLRQGADSAKQIRKGCSSSTR